MMSFDELARELRRMHENARYGEKAIMPTLFGIKYASEIERHRSTGRSVTELTRLAGRPSYEGEVNIGVRLANYVQIK